MAIENQHSTGRLHTIDVAIFSQANTTRITLRQEAQMATLFEASLALQTFEPIYSLYM